MTEEQIAILHSRVNLLPIEQFELLDPICKALYDFQEQYGKDGPQVLPNRIVALAAVDLLESYALTVWARE